MIDRSKTRDIPLHPSAVKGRSNDWNLCRGNHLGQRSCASATIGRTYGRKRSDQNTAQQLARSGPSTYGSRKARARSNGRDVPANAVRLQLHALAYNLGNFLRTLATPEPIKDRSLTSLKEKLIKIGAKVVSHGRYVAFQMAEVAIPRNLFADILRLIAELRPPPVTSTA